MSQFKKIYYPFGNLKFDNLGIFQSLKLRTLLGKIPPISLKLNFAPNTLGCHGLNNCFEVRETSYFERERERGRESLGDVTTSVVIRRRPAPLVATILDFNPRDRPEK